MANSFKYNIQTRDTKRSGLVYDVYFYIDGRQKCLRGYKTKTAARQAYTDYMEQVLTAPKVDSAKNRILYEDARRSYLHSLEHSLKESSRYVLIRAFITYHDRFFKGRDLRSLTKKDFLEYQDWLWSQKTKRGTLLSHKYALWVYGLFCTFYNWCIERFDLSPISVRPPKKKTQKREYKVWTQDDFNRFIAFVEKPRYKALFTLMFYSGIRIGEAQALKFKDYDGSSLFVHSTCSFLTLDDSSYKITETKNYRARHVPLPAPCRAVLDEWVKDKPSDDFMFGCGSPVSSHAIRSNFEIRVARAGVPRIRIHDLRHSYVTLLLTKYGASIPAVASLIGDTIDVVVSTYAHSVEEEQIAVINSII